MLIFTQAQLSSSSMFFFLIYFYFFIWLCQVLVVACELSCSMWNLVPWPGIEPRPPALGAQSLGPTGPPGKSLIYGFNKKNWMAQLHSAEWLSWTEMLSFLLASQPVTILNQNSAAVYFELLQFASTCYFKGAKICIPRNWRPWWPVLSSTVWLKTYSQRKRKKRGQSFSSVWIILFCKFLHRSFQTASLVFTQYLSLCRLSRAVGSQPLCQVASAGSVKSHISQPVMQPAEESSFSPRGPQASSWARRLSPIVREGGWSTHLPAIWKSIFRKDLTDIPTSKPRLAGWKGKSWGYLGESC